jgi:dTDP-glucose 4,6-dehydratase
MNILVTGGAGFIGSAFLRRLVAREPEHRFINVDKLTYAANLRSVAAVASLPNYVFERADIADPEAVESLFMRHRPDVVVHFAAESHVDRSILGPREFLRTNVEGTFHLLEAARRHWDRDHGRFHHVSTDEVYGSLGPTGHFVETTAYDPSSPYSASKAASDHFVRAYARTYGLRITVTNCSNNYGPYQFPEKLIPLMTLHAIERKPLPIYGRGVNVRDWLHVDDHVEAIWTVVQRGRVGETYNVGGDSERRNLDVVDAICASVSRHTGASLDELLGLKSYVPDRPGHDHRYAIDASKIRQELGWQPSRSFEAGIDETVRWYLDNRAWVDEVRSGEYRTWMDQNYGART